MRRAPVGPRVLNPGSGVADNRRQRILRIARFVVGGGLNTAVTYGSYLLLNLYLSYQLAYLLGYAVGIVFSYFFNSLVVFKTVPSWRGLLAFPAVYLVQYLVSAIALGLAVEKMGVPQRYAPILISVVTLPMTYLLVKFVLNKFNRQAQ